MEIWLPLAIIMGESAFLFLFPLFPSSIFARAARRFRIRWYCFALTYNGSSSEFWPTPSNCPGGGVAAGGALTRGMIPDPAEPGGGPRAGLADEPGGSFRLRLLAGSGPCKAGSSGRWADDGD